MRLTLILCAALLLTGCLFTEYVFTVNKDNSVDMSYTTAISKEYYSEELFSSSPEEDSLQNVEYGITTKAFEDETTKGTTREKHFDLITDLNEFPLLADSTQTAPKPMVTEEKKADHSLFTISYKPTLLGGKSEDFEQGETAEMAAKMLKNKVTWKVPFEVVNTNAKVRDDSLGVYTWEYTGAEGDSIYLQYKVPNSTAAGKASSIIPWIIVALAVLSTLLWLPNRKKSRAQAAQQDTPEPELHAQDDAQGEEHSPEETKTTPPEEQQ
ncbi:MAG: hypothetical protein ACOYIS_06930 [Candidatus Cloacimonadaceae bacterium]|jgi:hypothetical protein